MKIRIEETGADCHDVIVEIDGREAGRYHVDGDPETERARVERVYRQAVIEEALRERGLWYGG